VGKAPSDLYVVGKRRFEGMLKEIDASINWTGDSFSRMLFDELFFHRFDRIYEVGGHSYLLRNATEYFRENLNLLSYLKDQDFLDLYGRLEQTHTAKVIIAEGGVVRNSILGAGSRVRGEVEDSLISHNVYVARGARVRNCVILPFNVIEERALLEHTLVLGGKDAAVERDVRIGGTDAVSNKEHPQALKNGLTVIGQGMTVPRGSQIGAGCLVYGKMEKRLTKPLHLEDGASYRAR
jgi:glucose-1-phosphate adenylyltransferase